MSLLDEVIQLKKEGISEKDIIMEMQQRGVPPREIETALQQANIKDVVSNSQDYQDNYSQTTSKNYQAPPRGARKTKEIGGEQYYASENFGSEITPPQPSQAEQDYTQEQGYYQPMTQEYNPNYQNQEQYDQQYPQEQQQQVMYDQQPGMYDNQEVYDPNSGGMLDSETITEITEQVVQEKTNELKNHIDNLNEYRTVSQAKLTHIEERLHRIEQMMDKLQLSILEKVGSYIGNVEQVKKEMSMMRDSFGKVLTDENMNKLTHHTHHTHHTTTHHETKKKEPKTKTVHIVHHKSKSLGSESKAKPKKKRL